MILRSRRFRHWMARLALASVLLLALLPTLGRWVEASGQRLPPALVAMCTSAGLSLFAPDRLPPGETSPIPAGTMTVDDCPYCPLLAKIAPLVLVVLALFALPAPWRPSVREARGRRLAHVHGMLGARGPPVLA